MDTNETRHLDPPVEWQPDADAALTRLRARIAATPRAYLWWKWPVWASAAIVAAILLWPAGLALAQQFWQFLTLPKLAFVRVNAWPEGVPGPELKLGGLPIPPQHARDIDEARWRVHYDPRLPHAGVLFGSPKLSTTVSLSAGIVVKAADLELALARAGVKDQSVPRQWEHARLALHTSPLVIAEWPDVVLVQSLPLTLSASPNFDFDAFSALILRIGGVSAEDAARLAKSSDTIPPWLVPIPRELKAQSTIEQVALNSGTGTLVGEGERVTIMWTVPDRVYLLSGHLERGLALAVANAVE